MAGTSVTALTERILAGWPRGVSDEDLDAFEQLTARSTLPISEATDLAVALLEALPAGGLGAAEAARLRTALTFLTPLTVDAAPVNDAYLDMISRYRAAGPAPTLVATALTQLSHWISRHAPWRPVKEMEYAGQQQQMQQQQVQEQDPPPLLPRPGRWRSVGGKPLLLGDDFEDTTDPPPRVFRADLQDHEPGQPLSTDDVYTLVLDVGKDVGAFATAPFPEDALLAAPDDKTVFDLTVQVDSAEFDIIGGSSRTLRVPRSGPSKNKARFDISPLHDGPAMLTATVHYEGNFLAQLELTVMVGAATAEPMTVTSLGRPPDSVAALEPRDISLILAPAPGGGYTCTAVGSVGTQAVLPITVDELSLAVEAARQALLSVVNQVHGGRKVYQTELDIDPAAGDAALKVLARAGSRLFQRIFLHPAAGADAREIGLWLRDYATDPGLQLTLSVFAAQAPIPWAMLYLGDAAEGAELDWNLFLGLRHIVEQVPLRKLQGSKDNAITSTPQLSVSVNVNPTIDASMGITLVAAHQQSWADVAAHRRQLSVVPRSSRAEVVAALNDADSGDQVVYLYCHATAAGRNGDPDGAAIIMGTRADAVTLGDLNLDAPTSVQLGGRPLVFINACESAELSPRFYNGFVPYFMDKGARGVIGTECSTPVLFAIKWAEKFFDEFFDGARLGEVMLDLRRHFLIQHGNPLGLLYAMHCDSDTRVLPALDRVADAG